MPFLRRCRKPRIVNVSSGGGQLANGADGWAPAYCISKTALNRLTVQLAAALPDFAVNSVCPGWVWTDMRGSSGRVPWRKEHPGSSGSQQKLPKPRAENSGEIAKSSPGDLLSGCSGFGMQHMGVKPEDPGGFRSHNSAGKRGSLRLSPVIAGDKRDSHIKGAAVEHPAA